MQNKLTEIYTALLTHYGDPKWWPAKTPYEVIVGAILAQNTAWSNVKKAIANFGDNLSPEYVVRLKPDELADIIRPAGFFNQKASYLHEVTRWFGQYGNDVNVVNKLPLQRVRAELLALKGVGHETADSILLYAFGFPSFVVDAYTIRLLSRLPIDVGNGYEATKSLFEENLPLEAGFFNRYHALIVINAKEHCRKNPVCGGCPLVDVCEAGKGKTI
ncbi:endonuclease III [Clostridia bacterium]|nr:endonuclease III [Clostridia bacterium]